MEITFENVKIELETLRLRIEDTQAAVKLLKEFISLYEASHKQNPHDRS